MAMELSRACNRNDGKALPRTHFIETPCSYFLNLNLNLQGLKADDIELEMDKERRVVIRGQRYSKDVGVVKWRFRVVAENAGCRRKRRPFKMPEEVNVGAIRGSFEQGIVHVVMPKFRRSRLITPYHLLIFQSSASASHSPLQQTLRRTKRRRTRKLIAKSQRPLIPPIIV